MSNDSLRRAMRAWLRSALLPVLAMLVLAVAACARDPEPGTPAAAAEGERLMRQMSDALAGSHAFRFTTQETLDSPLRPPNGACCNSRVRSRCNGPTRCSSKSAARRPGRWSWRPTTTATPWRFATNHPAMGTGAGAGDDRRNARRRGEAICAAGARCRRGYSVPYDAFIGRNTKGGFVGREVIDGARCAHLHFTDEFIDVQLWIPESGQPLPRRVKLTYKQTRGAPTALLDFTDWDLAPQIADGTFAFQPGSAEKRIPFEQFTSRLLSGDQPASSTPAAAPGG